MATQARTGYVTNPLVLDAVQAAVAAVAAPEPPADSEASGSIVPLPPFPKVFTLPEVVRTWLARLRMLEGVPFQHLVPDAELLPPESIRFFHLDREWTDALTQGALSVGTVTTADRTELHNKHIFIRDEVDKEERSLRLVGGDTSGFAETRFVSGFLLRSRLVSGWPALHVRAFRDEIGPDDAPVKDFEPNRIRILRLERLAPAVLLCLLDGVPKVVHLEEPRSGVQYGVDLVPGTTPGSLIARVPLREVTTGKRLDKLGAPLPHTVRVPMRKGSPGVIAVSHLGFRIAAVPATKTSLVEGTGVGSAEMAMEMVQFPYRQVFGHGPAPAGLAGEDPDAFAPALAMEDVRALSEET